MVCCPCKRYCGFYWQLKQISTNHLHSACCNLSDTTVSINRQFANVKKKDINTNAADKCMQRAKPHCSGNAHFNLPAIIIVHISNSGLIDFKHTGLDQVIATFDKSILYIINQSTCSIHIMNPPSTIYCSAGCKHN